MLYAALGLYEEAISYISHCVPAHYDNADRDDMIVHCFTASDDPYTIHQCSLLIEQSPDNDIYYSIRATLHERTGNLAQALNDYNMAVALLPSNSEHKCQRGRLLLKLGRDNEATDDLSSAAKDPQSAPLALLALGKKDEAIASLDNDVSSLKDYTAARLFTLIGDYPKAIDHLRTALLTNGEAFCLFRSDADLAPLRDTQAYKDLISEIISTRNNIHQ